MSADHFEDLQLPRPDIYLTTGGGSHSQVTAAALVGLEDVFRNDPPAAVVVFGDVNSTLAAALSAVKLHLPVAHVEAGLRSGDWTMPEEINRVLTDRISQWLLTPSADADDNLAAEAVPFERIHRVGNVMIDSLFRELPHARQAGARLRDELKLPPRYGIVTLHRPANVDHADELVGLFGALEKVGCQLPLVFPIHPRTQSRIRELGISLPNHLRPVEPLGYHAFLGLLDGASLALTDSGGVQEESSVLGVPCLTLRDTTERPVTITLGTNRLVGRDPERIVAAATDALAENQQPSEIPLWDGKAANRLARVLLDDLVA